MLEQNVGAQVDSTLRVWCLPLMPGIGAREDPRTTIFQTFSLECWDWILIFESTQASLTCLAMAYSYESK